MPAPVRFSPLEGRQLDPPPLGAGEIHLWACHLNLAPDIVSSLAPLLSRDEHQRASRYRFERHRRRYTASWGLVRALLGAYSGQAPQELVITYGSQGKPTLDDAPGLEFNLSHSADQLVVGVQSGNRLGVDLEHLRSVEEWHRIARRSFSKKEVATLESLDESERLIGFFNCWTRKEALVKAWGEGVFTSLSRFEVSLRPGDAAALELLDDDRLTAEEWSLHHLEPAPGYLGALATDLPGPVSVRAWQVDPDRQRLPGIR